MVGNDAAFKLVKLEVNAFDMFVGPERFSE